MTQAVMMIQAVLTVLPGTWPTNDTWPRNALLVKGLCPFELK